MKPIWYFVGLLLLVMGLILLVAGINDVISPPSSPTVLAGLHPSIWWGALMVVSGAIFVYLNRNRRLQ